MQQFGTRILAAFGPALAAIALAVLAVAGMAPPALAIPVTDVSDDGQQTSRYETTPGAPGALLLDWGSVPFPATPDWTGDLERAVGGLEFGDFDNDDDLDLACGCYDASSSFPPITIHHTLIYRNDGGVLQTTPTWQSTDERHTGDVRFGDIDGDGRDDLYASNGGQGLDPSVVYLNGPGGIDTTPDWIAADATWSLGSQFADLDHDGRLDLVVANQGNSIVPSRPVSVFFNGPGGLETSPSWTSADSALSNSVSVADLNGDSNVSVIGHTFAADGATRIFQLPHRPIESIDRIELNGWLGIMFSTLDRRTGRIHFGFPLPSGVTIEVDYTYAAYPDIAFSRWVNYESGIYPNTAGTLAAVPGWTTGDAARADKGIAFSDQDLDGDPDLVLAGSDPTLLYRNDGGTLTSTWSHTNSFWGCQDLDWGDVDNDGDEDLATIHFSNRQLRIYLNRDGVLDPVPSWIYALGTSATEVAFGDVNGDGFLDVAAGSARSPLVLFYNTGPPVAAPTVGRATPESIRGTPNPFRDSVLLDVPAVSGARTLRVYDAAGRVVRQLGRRTGGGPIRWDGRTDSGRPVPPGVYWVSLGERGSSGRVVRVR